MARKLGPFGFAFQVLTRPSVQIGNFYNQQHHICIVCGGIGSNKCNCKPSNFKSQYSIFESGKLQFLRNKIINIVASHVLQALGYILCTSSFLSLSL